MLVEKEIIRDGTYWYTDEAGLPKKLVVTPELRKYWFEQGNQMLKDGLTVPVPYEHDFNAHPMTPKDKLINNAGWVKEYKNDDKALRSILDIQDEDVAKKLPRTIRWTSPWINSFTDGSGKERKNVISHLALTTRPRVTKQEPFKGIAAALSMATEHQMGTGTSAGATGTSAGGFCLSRAGRLAVLKKTKKVVPRYPMAFSMWAGGIKLSDEDMPKEDPEAENEDEMFEEDGDDPAEEEEDDISGLTDPLADAKSDVKMEELLCDLLQALGVPMPDESNEAEFKRHLYEAAMSKIKELTSKGMTKEQEGPDQNLPPSQQPNASQPNPLINQVQQEQQPMYMALSIEEINKLEDGPVKSMALSLHHTQNQLKSLTTAKLNEAGEARKARVANIVKRSPNVKTELEAMLALPAMALSMGDGGQVVDPMATTLTMLEKSIPNMPTLLTTDKTALSMQPHPTDASEMTNEKSTEIADNFARMMGCPPEKKTA